MIELHTLGEVKAHLPPDIFASISSVVAATLELVPTSNILDTELASVFGNTMYIVETIADLSAVRSFDEGPAGRRSILDAASEWFDVARWDADGAFAVFATVENADGGPQWFIPRAIADLVPYVAESIVKKGVADQR